MFWEPIDLDLIVARELRLIYEDLQVRLAVKRQLEYIGELVKEERQQYAQNDHT